MTTKTLAALTLATLSAPSTAREMRIGPERYAVTVPRADLSSPTPALARRPWHAVRCAGSIARRPRRAAGRAGACA